MVHHNNYTGNIIGNAIRIHCQLINTRRMRAVVVLCVCLCVYLLRAELAATYLIFESKVQCYEVPYGVPNVISLNQLAIEFVL
jgi:hypothetical protein